MCLKFRQEAEKKVTSNKSKLQQIDTSKIVLPPEPENKMKAEMFKRLKESIKTDGLMSPIQVVQVNNHYELLQGYWRLKAHKELGLNKILAGVFCGSS